MLSPDAIQLGHTLLVQLPSGERKSIRVEKSGQASLGKFGSFRSSLLIGHPFGLTYDIVSATELRVVPPKRLEDFGDIEANNEKIVDDVTAQALSQADIEAMKASGVSGEDMISAQIAQHTSFGLKTEFSKDKYRARKAAKFSKQFTVLEPTVFTVCDHLFNKDNQKMRDLRPDSLSEMITIANVRPGARVLVVDDVSGMLLAGVIERLGGMGKALTINDVESVPSHPALTFCNYDPAIVAKTHGTLNWAMTDPEFQPLSAKLQADASTTDPLQAAAGTTEPPAASSSATTVDAASSVSEAQAERIDRNQLRKAKQESTARAQQEVRAEFFAGEWEALLISSVHEPLSILRYLAPYLRPSAPVVVHGPHAEPLAKAHAALRADTGWLGAQMHQPWMRRHQAIPGRTHPMMNMTGSGGFLLSATKVSDNVKATSVLAFRKGRNPLASTSAGPSTNGAGSTDAGNESGAMQVDVAPGEA